MKSLVSQINEALRPVVESSDSDINTGIVYTIVSCMAEAKDNGYILDDSEIDEIADEYDIPRDYIEAYNTAFAVNTKAIKYLRQPQVNKGLSAYNENDLNVDAFADALRIKDPFVFVQPDGMQGEGGWLITFKKGPHFKYVEGTLEDADDSEGFLIIKLK